MKINSEIVMNAFRDQWLDIEIVDLKAGWKTVRIYDKQKTLEFALSDILSESLRELIISLYYLAGKEDVDVHRWEMLTRKDFDLTPEEAEWGRIHDPGMLDKNGEYPVEGWEATTGAKFEWSDEKRTLYWKLERKPSIIPDGELTLSLRLQEMGAEPGVYSWQRDWHVDLRDFSYIVCRALTRALKQWGFTGWWRNAWTHDFQLEYFLWLKAFALHREMEIDRGGAGLFQREMDILMADME